MPAISFLFKKIRMKVGIVINLKRKMIADQFLSEQKLIDADPHMKDAIESGYAIQVFNAH